MKPAYYAFEFLLLHLRPIQTAKTMAFSTLTMKFSVKIRPCLDVVGFASIHMCLDGLE
jgi:hypothetical protein